MNIFLIKDWIDSSFYSITRDASPRRVNISRKFRRISKIARLHKHLRRSALGHRVCPSSLFPSELGNLFPCTFNFIILPLGIFPFKKKKKNRVIQIIIVPKSRHHSIRINIIMIIIIIKFKNHYNVWRSFKIDRNRILPGYIDFQ